MPKRRGSNRWSLPRTLEAGTIAAGLRQCAPPRAAAQPFMSLGALYAALAFAIWGVFPLFFAQLASMAPLEILEHRIVWSLVFVVIVLAVRRQWAWMGR